MTHVFCRGKSKQCAGVVHIDDSATWEDVRDGTGVCPGCHDAARPKPRKISGGAKFIVAELENEPETGPKQKELF